MGKTAVKAKGNKKNGIVADLSAFCLDPLAEAFVYAYLINFNATKAYKKVSPNVTYESAMVLGYRMLQRTEVKEAIEQLRKIQLERFQISADKVLREISILAFQNLGDYGEWDAEGNFLLDPSAEIPHELKAAIAGIERETRYVPGEDGEMRPVHKLKFHLHSKTKGLEMLGRHLNLFRDNASAPVIVNFNIQNFNRPKPVQYTEVKGE